MDKTDSFGGGEAGFRQCWHKDDLDGYRAKISDLHPVIPAKAGIQRIADALTGGSRCSLLSLLSYVSAA